MIACGLRRCSLRIRLRHFLSACSVTEQLLITQMSASAVGGTRTKPPRSNSRASVDDSEKLSLQPNVWKLTLRGCMNSFFTARNYENCAKGGGFSDKKA